LIAIPAHANQICLRHWQTVIVMESYPHRLANDAVAARGGDWSYYSVVFGGIFAGLSGAVGPIWVKTMGRPF